MIGLEGIVDTLIPETEKRIGLIAKEAERTVSELCESAIDEAALLFFSKREDDPAKSH